MIGEFTDLTQRAFRFAAALTARTRIGDRDIECTAHNLSRSGVLLIAEFPATLPECLEFVLRSARGDLQVALRGRVARATRDDGTGASRVAVEFEDLDPEAKQQVENLLARVIEGNVPAPIERLRRGAPAAEVRRALEQVPLAHRITLAGRAGPLEREIFFRDPSPQVLEALARNPQLLPTEARALAEMPSLLPSTLEVLATDPRWGRDAELKIRVAAHLRVTPAVARKIIAELNRDALTELLRRPGLNPAFRPEILRSLGPDRRG